MNVLWTWLILAAAAWARAGGGQGFSGGNRGGGSSGGGFSGGGFSGRSSSGGGDDDDALFGLVLWLLLEHPVIGVPLLIAVAAVVIAAQRAGGAARRSHTVVHGHALASRPRFDALVARDPTFSEVLFLDLARLVVVRAHEDRGRGALDSLEAYLSPAVRAAMAQRPQPTKDVILGSARVSGFEIQGDVARLVVDCELNVTEGANKRLFLERWRFVRRADARTPGPDAMRALRCPSCGSAEEQLKDGRCRSCDAVRVDGRIQWFVDRVGLVSAKDVPRVELALGGGVEVGTDLPTLRQPDLRDRFKALRARDPSFDLDAFQRRAADVFLRVQQAWTDRKPEDARPYETDFLFQQHRYWIDRYNAEGIRNRLTDVQITRVEVARVLSDAWLDSVTVRIYASMRDWTEDKGGRVVGGSPDDPKVFSEYWTFVRAARAASKASDLDHCPSCGAPLDRVGAAGVCGYCDTKITTGDFDWVLSTIDQDESWRG